MSIGGAWHPLGAGPAAGYSAVLKLSLSTWKVWGSIPRPVKSDTRQPTARYRCDVSSELRCLGVKPRGRAPPLATTLRYYSAFNETIAAKIWFFKKILCAAIVTADTSYSRNSHLPIVSQQHQWQNCSLSTTHQKSWNTGIVASYHNKSFSKLN